MLGAVVQGLIPIVGAARETGTSMLIEDVACPVDKLGAMTMDLIEMFTKYEYHDASCFGHALEGNLHLVFSQVRRRPSPLCVFIVHRLGSARSKYELRMRAVASLV